MNVNSTVNSMDKDFVMSILKPCFQYSDEIRILKIGDITEKMHFTSEIVQLEVEYFKNGRPHRQGLILKIPNTGDSRSYFSRFDFYHKEVRIYSHIIPRMTQLLGDRIFPTHYSTTSSGILVLEDASVQGYRSGAQGEFFDLEQNYVILQALAQFHAASYRVQRENAQILDEVAFDRTIAIDSRQDWIDTWQPVLCQLLRQRGATHLTGKLERALSFLKRTDEHVYSTVSHDHFKMVVLNHGDFRKHNLLLKFAEGCLQNVKLIDFQACWWSSPAFDFLVHLVFSVQPRVVDGHFDLLVDAYVGFLKAALHDLDCSCDYDKGDFMRDVARLHFVVIACLLARCTFSYNIDHAKVADTLMGQRQKGHSYGECLEDEAFAESLFEWLQLCEKLGVFQTLETLGVDEVGDAESVV